MSVESKTESSRVEVDEVGDASGVTMSHEEREKVGSDRNTMR